ncbi:MAG: hypothetical protein ACLUGG_11835, partial [Oscillospiraceae bacterium]
AVPFPENNFMLFYECRPKGHAFCFGSETIYFSHVGKPAQGAGDTAEPSAASGGRSEAELLKAGSGRKGQWPDAPRPCRTVMER